MKKPDKFQVGDTAWLPGDWRGRDANRFTAYRVIERTKTGYVMQNGLFSEKVSTLKANRDYFTTLAKEDWEWKRANRYKIVREVENVDTALLRKVAEVIGYTP